MERERETAIQRFGSFLRYMIQMSDDPSDVWWVEHRIGGPAIRHEDGSVYWYVNGVDYIYTASYCKVCGYDDETTLIWILKYGEYLPDTMTQDDFYND